jgi:hypothetical protein
VTVSLKQSLQGDTRNNIAVNDRNVGTFVDYRVVTIQLAECLPSSRDNPRQVQSKRNRYPAAFVEFTAVTLNLWLVQTSRYPGGAEQKI